MAKLTPFQSWVLDRMRLGARIIEPAGHSKPYLEISSADNERRKTGGNFFPRKTLEALKPHLKDCGFDIYGIPGHVWKIKGEKQWLK